MGVPHAIVLWLFLQLEAWSQTVLIDSCTTPQLEWVPAWLQTVVLDSTLRAVVAPAIALFVLLDNVLADRRGPRAWGIQSLGVELGGACVLSW
jgi:hypothetical protein